MILTWILTVFFIVGLLDRTLLGGRIGLAASFEEGLAGTAQLILSMAGMMCIAPVLGQWILHLSEGGSLPGGADPAMLAGAILAIDMGGYPLATVISSDPEVVYLSGILLASMLGTTLVYTVPLFYSMCGEQEIRHLSGGLVLGIAAIPLGVFAGGLCGGIGIAKVLQNMAPILVLSLLLVIVLCAARELALRALRIAGRVVSIASAVVLGIAVVQDRLGLTWIPGLDPLEGQLTIIAGIGITLAGAYPMMTCVCKALRPLIRVLARWLGVTPACVDGMMGAMANPLLYFRNLSGWSRREMIISMAFVVPAQCILGDHLGYIQTAAAGYTGGMILVKAAAGIAGVLIAEIYCVLLRI